MHVQISKIGISSTIQIIQIYWSGRWFSFCDLSVFFRFTFRLTTSAERQYQSGN